MQEEPEESLPYSAGAVVNAILQDALDRERELTHMELQKRLYITYGIYRAEIGKKLFDEPIRAWQYGPIVASIYHTFKSFKNKIITELYKDSDPFAEEEDVIPRVENDKKLEKIIDLVSEVYADSNAKDLSTITHISGSPWRKVWDEYPNENKIIDDDLINEYFKKEVIPYTGNIMQANRIALELHQKYGNDLLAGSLLEAS